MKALNLMKIVIAVVIAFIANVTIYASTPDNNLIYNAEEVNGMKVAETVYKMDGNMLTNYMKYNYKYDENKQMTENLSQNGTAQKSLGQ